MIKVMMCLSRRAVLSREDFQSFWRESHGPFIMQHAEKLKIKKYVQFHTASSPLNEALKNSRGMLNAFDGIAEIWLDFNSEEDLIISMGEYGVADIAEILIASENNFIDHSQSTAFVVNEISF